MLALSSLGKGCAQSSIRLLDLVVQTCRPREVVLICKDAVSRIKRRCETYAPRVIIDHHSDSDSDTESLQDDVVS